MGRGVKWHKYSRHTWLNSRLVSDSTLEVTWSPSDNIHRAFHKINSRPWTRREFKNKHDAFDWVESVLRGETT